MDPKEAQKTRSGKYGIAIRDDGNVTRPAEFAAVPDDEWLDPVNYSYPCPDAAHTASAARYWGKADDRAKYSADDQAAIDKRLAMMEEKFNIGQHHDMNAAMTDYVQVGASSRIMAAADAPNAKESGWKWRVQIVEGGVTKDGSADYPLAVLHAAAPIYEGARVFALSYAQHDNPANPYGKSVRDIVGWLSEVKPNTTGLEGTFSILKSAPWLRDGIVDAWNSGKKDIVGFSHDVTAAVPRGATLPIKVQRIIRVDSVDVVYNPIAGGKLLRMAAAAKAGLNQKEDTMWKKLLAAFREKRPELVAQIDALEAKGEEITEADINELVAASAALPPIKRDDVKEMLEKIVSAAAEISTKEAKEMVAESRATLDKAQRLQACTRVLIREVAQSNLPLAAQKRIEEAFEGQVFEEATLQAAIKKEKEYIDVLTGSGLPEGVGGLRMEMGADEPEKLQAACDKLLGADVAEKFSGVVPFRSLRAAYERLTGDREMRGIPSREGMKLGQAFMEMMKLSAAYASASFTFVLGNSMYRRLIREYNAVNYNEDVLISYYRNAENFKTLEIVQVGYFADIDDLDPETKDYPEVVMPTDIEATYAINQKGVILTITRKVLMNDDLKTVTQLVSKLGRAARRTHARRAWAKIIDNATFKGDSTALFHSDHANLGSVTLTNDTTGITTLTNRLKAMYAQTEQDSGEGLALVPMYEWVPRDLLEIAKALNQTAPGATVPNPHAGLFGQNHERIICNPLFTDTNDWGLVADKNDAELLEAAYINGQREPEFFVADNPTIGQMFVADKLQYKLRHEYEFEIADFRGFDKSVVAGGT